MIARWLQINLPSNSLITVFLNQGFSYKKKRDEREGQNELDDKEKINYREYSYFKNVLENIDQYKITSLKEHYKYLILNLLVKQAPLRTTFYTTAKFATKQKDIKENINYVYLSTVLKVPMVDFIVQKDKVSNTKSYSNNKN